MDLSVIKAIRMRKEEFDRERRDLSEKGEI